MYISVLPAAVLQPSRASDRNCGTNKNCSGFSIKILSKEENSPCAHRDGHGAESGADPESGYIFRIRIRIFGKKPNPEPDSVWMVWCM